MNLFVLVSTGQRVANLPPVLEIAQRGDQVLWVESDEANRLNWTAGPRAVLEAQGLQTWQVVRLAHVNDPALLTATLEPIARAVTGRYAAVYLVTNGGTKHTPIGLLNAFHCCAPRLLYGDERPAVYSVFPPGLAAPPAVAPYTRHRLDLADILRLNGYAVATGCQPVRLWPNPLPADLRQEQYGVDEQYTYQLHEQHHAWASVPTGAQRVRFEELEGLVPDTYERWMKTLEQLRFAMTAENQESAYYSTLELEDAACQAAFGTAREVRFEELADLVRAPYERWMRTLELLQYAMTTQNLNSTYNGTLRLRDAARQAANRRAYGLTPPAALIGPSLERAVARRVWGWLQANPHPAVQSVWIGVTIARENTGHQAEAEFDLLLVLKNGVLFHLECKSANVEPRDLDVNTHRLRQAGSQLARSAVVIPVFTRCAATPWFAALHATRLRLEEQLGRPHVLPFTWPGQPEVYELPNADPSEAFRCQPFEDGLTALLRPYRP